VDGAKLEIPLEIEKVMTFLLFHVYNSVCNPPSFVESCLDALEKLCVAFIRAIGAPKDLSLSILYSTLLLISKNK